MTRLRAASAAELFAVGLFALTLLLSICAVRLSIGPLPVRMLTLLACLAVLTLVERTSRSVVLVALPAGWRADQVRPALTTAMKQLPRTLCRSLTWDHGKEMAEHARFTADTGVPVYFCDPRSPWQWASNQNTNGLVRKYLPRTADLRRFSQADLDRIAAELNGRPRQLLGFQTPSRVLAAALR